jgi:dihydrodiol dehydrogenase / D-xylose 1-dehydrogenase (NADP)
MTKDLMVDPKTRGVNDVEHLITAAASSSSKKSAESFVADVVDPVQGSKAQCTAYGSYEELVKDPNVDIIYIGTPHSHHYQNCMLALTNGKPVVCEKAITVNAAQARALVDEAKKRNLFLMEAEWTRFFPLSIAIRNKIVNGDIGEVLRVSSDLSTGEAPEMYETSHRNVNKDLAGGALLDLGVYSLLWLFQVSLYVTNSDSEDMLMLDVFRPFTILFRRRNGKHRSSEVP